ncbi:MAG: NAD(P)-dependent methylenetetrahydromethanopterin dehydrogenase [Methylococcaceae bacterium]
MEKPFILHMLTTAKNLSPFDVNMAMDAGWVSAMPYTNIEASEVQGLVQDAIFSRSAKNLKRTSIFIGGRDTKQAMDMLKIAKQSMIPPFEVSVFADPSGAFTTAAAMVAAAEHELLTKFQTTLEGKNVLALGGTGPVGQAAAVIAAKAGANVRIIGRQLEKAQHIADLCNDEFGEGQTNITAGADADKGEYIKTADVVFATGAAGIELLSAALIATAAQLKVVADVNAVPPSGIAGIDAMYNGKLVEGSISGAVGLGALAIGNVKYKTQNLLLKRMINSDKPIYLHFEHAFEVAREYIKSSRSSS